MSRVAEALRKSRGAATARPVPVTDEDAGLRAAIEVPWDFTDVPAVPDALDDAGLPVETAGPVHQPLHENPLPREELSALVQQLFRSTDGTPGVRSVLFSAVGPAAGSTPLCAWAAHELAERSAEPVCAVDANLQAPGLHRVFGLPEARGLSDALTDPRAGSNLTELVTRVTTHLWLLPAGSAGEAAARRHLRPEQLRARMEQLLTSFRYVVVDASSPAMQGNAATLGRIVDGVVLVVQANATRRKAARSMADHLQAMDVRVLGAVLTDRTFPIPAALYHRL